VRFNYDRTFEKKFARTQDLEDTMGDLAEETANEARRLALARAFETGRFMASIEAESGQDEIGAMGRVNSHDPAAPHIEFGTRNMPPEAILRRALENTFGTRNITTRRR
jgi:hypothetical protein